MSPRHVAPLLLLALALPGCASLAWLWRRPPRLAPCPGPIPSTDTLPPGDGRWQDRARYRGGDVDVGLALVAEKRAERLVLVALNSFGARVLAVTQERDAIRADAGPAHQIPPETLLRDWHAARAAATPRVDLTRPECGYTASFVVEAP